jgi:uncharacterized membrane protein YcfT
MASGLFGGSLLFLESEWIHRLLLIPVVMLSLLAVLSIAKRQADWSLLILAVTGASIMLSAVVYEERFGGAFEQIATVIGGFLLMVFHLVNRHKLLHQTTSNPA